MDIIKELLKIGKIDQNTADSFYSSGKITLEEAEKFVLEKNIVSPEELLKIKAQLGNVDYMLSLPEDIPPEVLDLLSEESAQFYKIIPISKSGNVIEFGIVDPTNQRSLDAIKFLARQIGLDYKVYVILYSEFEKVARKYKTIKREVKTALKELMEEEVPSESLEKVEEQVSPEQLSNLSAEAPINRVVNIILQNAIEGNASDIHIERTLDKTRVRFRFLGELHESLLLPAKIHNAIVARIKVLANLRIDETRLPQDGRFSITFQGRNIDFRVSTFPAIRGEKVVLRVLDPGKGLKKMSELGLEGRNLELIEKASQMPYGMILVTGPTGSGKTTTLYTILMKLNDEKVNIVTLEDPVEYYIDGINQSQVRPDIGYTFASGLRSILRQDPNVIMVGEIRDRESAELAVNAALTGHIVLSTLHTNNAVGVIPRILDLGVMPFLLPSALNIMISQRLVRVLCDNCKKKIKPPAKIKNIILEELEDLPSQEKEKIDLSEIYVWQAVGCKKCNDQGYSGRIGIYEILEMTPELKRIVVEKPVESNILKEAKRQGMISLRQDGILKVLRGITSMEEVLRVTAEY
ncbi:Type II secretion system protein E [bacterium HR34]|nr:Type II secretion system protein E [bacterium HR34]